jgi:hypothetical protein
VQAVLCQAGTPFKAHVTVALEGTRGRASGRFWMAGARTPVRLVVPGVPTRLVADPEDDLLRWLGPDEIPDNPWALFFGHHPLVIVYGTQGDPAYQRAMRHQAEAQAAGWRAIGDGPLADLAGVKVVPDSAVTEADRGEAHLIVIGKPGTNRLMDELVDRLPVRFGADGSVTVGERSITGTDLVTITNRRSPWNPDRLLRTWSGSTVPAMALPSGESASGGNFPLVNAAWVARHGRLLAWSDAGARDRRSYAFAPPKASAVPGRRR